MNKVVKSYCCAECNGFLLKVEGQTFWMYHARNKIFLHDTDGHGTEGRRIGVYRTEEEAREEVVRVAIARTQVHHAVPDLMRVSAGNAAPT